MELIVAGTILIALGICSSIAYFIVKRVTESPVFLKKRIDDLKTELADKRKSERKWISKYNKREQTPKLDGEYDLESADGIGALVKDFVPEIKDWLPKKWQKHLDNPKTIDTIVDIGTEIYKKDPDKLKDFISDNILKKAGTKPESSTQQSEPTDYV